VPRATHRAGNLPAEATTFVGRRAEFAEARRKLSATRLLSLVGPGGVGKTRLAIRIAADLVRGFSGGAWLAELAELHDPALLANALMAALDLRDQAAEPRSLLLSYLRERELLLVVDNCEHLLEATARLIDEVVRAAPKVRVIATSREPLSVAGEHVLPVPPLELPSPDAAEPLAHLVQNEAVTLFVERAVAATGTFELSGANRAAVVDLCRRLDGLPLAIELAAVRTRALSPGQIRDRLSDRFGLLTGGSRAALPRANFTNFINAVWLDAGQSTTWWYFFGTGVDALSVFATADIKLNNQGAWHRSVNFGKRLLNDGRAWYEVTIINDGPGGAFHNLQGGGLT
jgi:hypothetical protein